MTDAAARPVKTLPFATDTRSAGVLLHVTSLQGGHGIGDLGPAARRWIDLLADAQQSWWQMLPLGPPGPGDSPYNCYSAVAGNTLLISLDDLAESGLLTQQDLAEGPEATDHVSFEATRAYKLDRLRLAWQNCRRHQSGLEQAEEEFRNANAEWLSDYALFMALRSAHGNRPWGEWPSPLRLRDRAALSEACQAHADAIDFECFVQFVFWKQLQALRAHAHQKAIGLIGDLPMFVSGDSADVWSRPELFQLDADLRPVAVAGVPPDAFSTTGQMWNNPLYDWPAMSADDYAWWTRRLAAAFTQADAVRLDHFRGFESYWRIPSGSPTAETGQWTPGPGAPFFEAIRRRLGPVQFVAEDLGLITNEVHALRRLLQLPGMRVLQFGFGSTPDPLHLPHRFSHDCITYSGTHDNDTTLGWFKSLDTHAQARWQSYADTGEDADPVWATIRLAWASVAALAIVPLQDVLTLPTSARMNRPSSTDDNWTWRLGNFDRVVEGLRRLASLTRTYGRV